VPSSHARKTLACTPLTFSSSSTHRLIEGGCDEDDDDGDTIEASEREEVNLLTV